MKKLFSCFLFVLILVGCSDDKNPSEAPIANLELPASTAEQPIVGGETVVVKGDGFTSTDEIWFYEVKTRASKEGVKAENVSLTSGGISFTAPNLSGQCQVVLLRNAQEFTLGTMVFTAAAEMVQCLATGVDGAMYTIDLETGEYTKVGSLPSSVYQFEDIIYSFTTKTTYGLAYDEDEYDSGIGAYNVENNTFNFLIENNEEAVCVLDKNGELYKLGQDEDNELTLYKISNDKSEKVTSFGSLDDITDDYICSAVFDTTFENIIVAHEGSSFGGCIKLNLKDSSIQLIESAETSDCSLFWIGNDLCIANYDDEDDSTSIYALDLSGNKRGKLLASFKGEWYEYEYDNQNNKLYCLSDVFTDVGNTLAVYDFVSEQLSTIKEGLPIYEIVLVQ